MTMTILNKPFYFNSLKTSMVLLMLALFLLNPINLLAKNYVSLSSIKNGKSYQNSASIIDLEKNIEVEKIDLGQSYKRPGSFIQTKDTNNKYYYQHTSKTDAMLKVFDAKTFSLKYSAKIGQLDSVLLAEYEVKTFFDVSPDSSKLYIQTKKNKVRQIMVFDNNTGELLKELPLLKSKSYSFLSDNRDYIFTQYISKHILSIHDAKSLKKIQDVQLKTNTSSINKYGGNYQDILFISARVKYRNNKNAYKVKMLNLKTKEKTTKDMVSNGKPIYVKDEINDVFYVAAKQVKSNQLILMKLSDDQLTQIDTNGLKLYPKNIITHEDSDKILIIGKRDNLLLDLSNPKNSIKMDQPFDTANTIWNPLNHRLYLREGSGSEVAVFDTLSGKKISRSGTGRPGVKFGQFLASAAFTAVGYNYGYIAYAYINSSTQMLLNVNGDKLYVINSKTNDVTQFDATNLTGRKAIATGGGTGLIYQNKEHPDSLIVISSKKFNIINDKDFTLKKQIKFDEFVGLDIESSLIFIKQNNKVKALSMIDGAYLPNLPLGQDVYNIIPLEVE